MKKIFPVILILIISSFFLFYKYDQIPKGLVHDENELARTAFSLENKPYTPFTPVADGHGTPYFYLLLVSFKTFGVNQFALRLPSRIFGILSVLLFFLIFKNIYKKEKKLTTYYLLLTTFVLVSSRWFLHFSRVAFEAPFLLMVELVSLYFTLLFLGNKQNKFIILSGIFAGIAFNSYQPGRIFFLVPLFAFLIKKINYRQILYFLTTFLIVILPMSLYLLANPSKDIRINQQFFLKNTGLTVGKKVEFLSSNIIDTSLMFFTKGDMSGQHNYTGKPALNPILSFLFLTGLIIGVIKLRRDFYFLLFIFYFLISLLPTILTYPWENPNMLRTYTVLPSVVYFVGLTIFFLINYLNKSIKVKLFKYLILTTFCLLLAISSFYEMRTYFKYQPLVFKQAFDVPDYLPIIRQNAERDDLWSF